VPLSGRPNSSRNRTIGAKNGLNAIAGLVCGLFGRFCSGARISAAAAYREANRKEAARNRNNGIFRKPIFQCEKLAELTQTTIIPKKINTRLTDCTGTQPSLRDLSCGETTITRNRTRVDAQKLGGKYQRSRGGQGRSGRRDRHL
jgi:hypothetical protein